MQKPNSKYEAIYIVNAELGDEARAALIAKFNAIIENGGTIDKIDEWGKRRMAYEINDMHDGYYVYVAFTAPQDLPAELERVLKITDGILRWIVVNIDEK